MTEYLNIAYKCIWMTSASMTPSMVMAVNNINWEITAELQRSSEIREF